MGNQPFLGRFVVIRRDEEQSVRGRQEKLKLYALDIKKPELAPGTTVEAAKPAEWKTGEEPAPAPAT